MPYLSSWGKCMSRFSRGRWALAMLLAGLLTACASTVPKTLVDGLPEALSQRAAQAEPTRHRGEEVRWGGEILSVNNLPRSTEVELFGRPLSDNAEPRPDGGEGVRFIARVDGFLDPAQYRADKRMSVRGRLHDPVVRLVGAYPYRYPVVVVSAHHLWPVYRPPPPPAYSDPFYDPWWPWWGPWWRRHHWPYGW